MITRFPLVSPEECAKIVKLLGEKEWLKGQAGSEAYQQQVKLNEEIPLGENSQVDILIQRLTTLITESEFVTKRTIPRHLARPRFNRYRDGAEYKWHADAAFMGQQPEIRTDYSMTLFLTDDYEGGELVLDYPSGARIRIKEPPGTLVFYPSGVLHCVTPVTSGERIAMVCWVESHIRDPQKRDALVEATILCDDLEQEASLSEYHIRLTNLKHNLYRQFMGS